MDKPLYSRTEPILLPYYPRFVYLSLLELGYQEQHIFDGLDLLAEQLHDEHYRLSIEQHEQFILRALELSANPHLAIQLGKMFDPANANLALLAVANSGNITKALHMMMRYNRIFTRVFSIRSLQIGNQAVMEIDSHLEHDDVIYFAMSAFVLFLDKFFTDVLDGTHLVQRVQLKVPQPSDFAQVEHEFPCTMSFSQEQNRVYFNKELLDQPMRQADPQTVRLLIEMSDQQLADAETEMSLLGAVKSIVIDRIASPPKLDEVAKTLGVSPRGLRRKLAQSGTTYQKVLDAIRFKMASKLLQETKEPIASIAYELGFVNASDFGRAFKRYSGVSPSSVRNSKR